MQEDAYERCRPSVLFGNFASSWQRAQLCMRALQVWTAGRNLSAAACCKATRLVTSKEIKMTNIPTVRFPTVSFEFFIDIILPAALWPWGRLSL